MEPRNPKIFVIVLNFNGGDLLLKCLASVFQSDYSNFEVVLVDNASQDGSFEKARSAYSKAHFIKNSENLGFAKGNNSAIRFALEKFADYVFILNNDAIIEKDTISTLLRASRKNPIGITSPLILKPDKKTIWFAGGKIDWFKMRAFHLIVPKSNTKPYQSEYLTGCAMLVQKEVFQKIGLFDERFFLYYEDTDFSLRAHKAGFSLFIIPATQIVHFEKSNTKNSAKTYWLVLSALLFFNFHATWLQKFWTIPCFYLRKIKNAYFVFFSPTPIVQNVKKAYQDYKKFIK